jgi:hypothetical protein
VPEPVNIADVVTSFYSELKSVAADLNAVSDELGKSISEINVVLKNLNLGVTVWTKLRERGPDFEHGDETYWSEELGYAKYQGRWGICLRQLDGHIGQDVENEEIWHFNDAPRALRLSAIDHLVGLLQKLSEEGSKTTQKIREKLSDAQDVAVALNKAAFVPRQRRTTGAAITFEEAK